MVDTGHDKLGHDKPRPGRPGTDRTGPDPLPSRAPLGISVGIGTAAVVAAAFADAAVPHHLISLRWAVLTVTVACFALWAADALAALIVTAVAFLLANGFMVNRQGELSWHGRDDLWRLAVLLLGALLGVAVGQVRAHRAAQRRYVDLEAWANGTGLGRGRGFGGMSR